MIEQFSFACIPRLSCFPVVSRRVCSSLPPTQAWRRCWRWSSRRFRSSCQRSSCKLHHCSRAFSGQLVSVQAGVQSGKWMVGEGVEHNIICLQFPPSPMWPPLEHLLPCASHAAASDRAPDHTHNGDDGNDNWSEEPAAGSPGNIQQGL